MKERSKEILELLASDVCCLSADQIAANWWPLNGNGQFQAHKEIARLEKAGWLRIGQPLSRPIQLGRQPLYHWKPGQGVPDFVGYSRVLQQRSRGRLKKTKICFATCKSRHLLGVGHPGPIRLAQLTHELHVSELFLRYRRGGGSSMRWCGEQRLPADWKLRTRPDALLTDHHGNFVRAVEYGGDYSARRLEELHHGLSSILLAYEVW